MAHCGDWDQGSEKTGNESSSQCYAMWNKNIRDKFYTLVFVNEGRSR